MNYEMIYKLLKYVLQGGIIYLFFKFVPKDPMSDSAILLMASITIFAYAVLENVLNMFHNNDGVLTNAQCDTKCSTKELMTSLPPTTSVPIQEHSATIAKLSELDQKLKQMEESRKVFEDQISKMSFSSNVSSNASVSSESSRSNSSNNDEKVTMNTVAMNTVTMKGVTKNSDGSYMLLPEENKSAKAIGSRAVDDVMSANDELMLASNYTDFTVFPPGNDTFVKGSSYLPPANWYPVPPRPPVCVTEKVCPVCPIYTDGANVNLQDWDSSRRLTPPDNINTDFVMGKLNSGR